MSKFPKVYDRTAPRAMRVFIRELRISPISAAAILGNLGHETGGFTLMQEVKPVVAGSRGGFGWAQWTGPRRKAFEAWAKAKGLDIRSFEANCGYVIHELKGEYAASLSALKAATTLRDKTIAFERSYERAGVKHYESRVRYAERALEVFDAEKGVNPKPITESRTAGGSLAAGAGAAAVVAESTTKAVDELTKANDSLSAGTILGLVIGVLILIGAGVALYARWDDAGRPLPGWLERWVRQ